MTKDEQRAELYRISKEFDALTHKAEGMFFTNHGYRPTTIMQARFRFREAAMWLTEWINTSD